MPTGPCPAAPTWAIRSIPVRTRDGPERLDQAYRRLLNDTPPDGPPSSSATATPAPGRVPDPRG
jgi:hypothetical protein